MFPKINVHLVYCVTLKAFYQLLTDGKTSCFTICNRKGVPKNCCCSCCCSCLLEFNNEQKTLGELNSSLENPEKEVEIREENLSDAHISFWAILMTGLFGVLLAGLQVYAIASLVQIPLTEVIEDVPNYILSLFHVTVFLLTAVVTYAVLTADEPVERELLKYVVRNFDYYYKKFKQHPQPQDEEEPQQQLQANDVVQKVSNIVGALAYKQFNPDIVVEQSSKGAEDDLLKHKGTT